MGGVADLPDELLEHVLERDQAEEATVVLDHTAHVHPRRRSCGQRLVQPVVRPQGREGAQQLVLDRLVVAGSTSTTSLMCT